MTEEEFTQLADQGKVERTDATSQPDSTSPQLPDLGEFLSVLTGLRQMRRHLDTPPTFTPKTFAEQIQFYDDGTEQRMYLYVNKTWMSVALSGGDSMVVTILPGNGFLSTDATIGQNSGAVTPSVNFADTKVASWYLTCKVPRGATSIASIKVIYNAGSTGNLFLWFHTEKANLDTAEVHTADTTDALTAYPGVSFDGKIRTITVPATAYDGLGDIDEDDLISLQIKRDASDSTDTYNAVWVVLGVQITFA